MGFLIAMVAPRLAGISGGAVDTVCDSNQNRMISMMSGYFEKTNRYPNKLTNIVEQVDTNQFQVPFVSDDDPDNGPETLASELMTRNHFRLHVLHPKEVNELKSMGITTVYNLNSYEGLDDSGAAKAATHADGLAYVAPTTAGSLMEEFNLSTDYDSANRALGVLMIGMGAPDSAEHPTFVRHTDERGWGEADFLGRIVLGFGPENGLVTSGIVSNAAHCPGGIQNADNVTYNDYNIVLPRLQSTIDRFDSDVKEEYLAIAYNDEPVSGYDITNNDDNLKVRTYKLEAMENYQYATICPEGHKFPADDEEFWGLDLSATNGTLD